jgi:Protein of unknown function (DUF3363)
MGLAEKKRTGVWAIDPQIETKLRGLGERGDIVGAYEQGHACARHRPPSWRLRGDHALWRALHQLHRERAADAVAEEEKLADAEVIHQPELIVGEGVPRIVDRHRAGGFAATGVALVHGDDAEVVLEFLRDV